MWVINRARENRVRRPLLVPCGFHFQPANTPSLIQNIRLSPFNLPDRRGNVSLVFHQPERHLPQQHRHRAELYDYLGDRQTFDLFHVRRHVCYH